MKVLAEVSSNVSERCSLCKEFWKDADRFQNSVNHFQDFHNLDCLHIGQRTITGGDGEPWHLTVAFFGTK